MKATELMELSDSALRAQLDTVKYLCWRAGWKSLVWLVVALGTFGLEYSLETFESHFHPVIAYIGMGVLAGGVLLSGIVFVVSIVKWWDLCTERWACKQLLVARDTPPS